MPSPLARAKAPRDRQPLIDLGLFARQSHEALAHLYDPVYLQAHPLARLLPVRPDEPLGRRSTDGAALREALLDAIDALRPAASVDPRAPRGHQILTLRYVEGLDPDAIQSRLAIGRSQFYREHQRALEALVSLLWERWRLAERGAAERVQDEHAREESGQADRVRTYPPRGIPPGNLPLSLTSFVGREREIGEVQELLRAHRLVTLTGSGGCGKTRLALEIARGLLRDQPQDYSDGVWLVELASLSDPLLVRQAVLSSLGIREASGQPILETLLAYLKSRRVLLVLDNCEHLVDACASLSESLLQTCPTLTILATSREPLRIDGEMLYRVPSLSVPSEDGAFTLERPEESESVHLFRERAAAVSPGFQVSEANAPAVARICRRLDGIPLAIELAAVPLRVLGVEQIAGRLDDRFRLLVGGSRTALPRHQTLRAAIDWSHDLLTEPERRLFRRLAAFQGLFQLEDVEAVCADADLSREHVLSLLGQLVGKSLVMVQEAGAEAAYYLLEMVREYAREALVEAGEAEDLAARHRAWYVEVAEMAGPRLWGADQAEWLERLELEHTNFRVVLAWCRERDATLGLRLANGLWRFWADRGYFTEGRDWLGQLLARAPERTRLRARALGALGYLQGFLKELSAAAIADEESLSIFQEIGDLVGSGWALVHVAQTAVSRGEYGAARGNFERGLDALFSAGDLAEPGDRSHIGIASVELGEIRRLEGDNRRANLLFEQAVAAFREAQDQRGIGYTYLRIGRLYLSEGRHVEARRWLDESLRLSRETRMGEILSEALVQLAALARVEGDYERSRDLLEECLAFCRENRRQHRIGWVQLNMGRLALMVGDYEQAATLLRDSLLGLRTRDDRRGSLVGVVARGALAIRQRASALGVRLTAAATSLDELLLPGLDPDERTALEACVAAAREGLGDQAFAKAWAEGQAMTLEQAVEYALGEDDSA